MMRCRVDAFATMGGSPSELLHGQMRSAMTGEGEPLRPLDCEGEAGLLSRTQAG